MMPVCIRINSQSRWKSFSFFILVLLYLIPLRSNADGQESGLVHYMMDSRLWEELLQNEATWFKTSEARAIANNVLAFQQSAGGWPKNIDYSQPLTPREIKTIKKRTKNFRPTIDNGATYSELYFLADMYTYTGEERYLAAFNRGFDYLLEAQYDNGGWPQYYPLRKGYHTHITYNDNAMVGVLMLIHDVVQQKPTLRFVDRTRREKALQAEIKGIDCILRTQQSRDGKKTVWCAQHDEVTFKPAPARKYELVSLSGKESAGILLYLMELENPSEAIKKAIEDGIDWFKRVQIDSIKIIHIPDENSPTGMNQVVVRDENAEPVWARFYDVDSDVLFFSDRDGQRYQKLADISSERRNEYGWYGTWPKTALKYYRDVWAPKWMSADENQR